MPQSHTIGDAAPESVLRVLRGPMGARIASLTGSSGSVKTARGYANTVRRIGAYSFEHFITFIIAEGERPVRPADELRPERGKSEEERQ